MKNNIEEMPYTKWYKVENRYVKIFNEYIGVLCILEEVQAKGLSKNYIHIEGYKRKVLKLSPNRSFFKTEKEAIEYVIKETEKENNKDMEMISNIESNIEKRNYYLKTCYITLENILKYENI